MAKIRIVGDSSGYVELAAPNAAGNNTLELPSNATKLVGADASNSLNVTGIATFSSGIVVSAGSTSAPSISPTGDSNTGIFFPSADTVAIGEGGVEALRIHSSSNIGIGTTNPLTKVHIQGTGNGSSGSTGLSDSSSASALLLKPTIGSGTALALGTIATGGHYIQGLYAASSVDSVRDVQINPYGGSIGIGTFADAFGGVPGNSTFVVATTGLERLRIDSSGRVTMPYQPAFMVRGDENTTKAANSKFSFTSSTTGSTKVCFDRLGNWSNANDRFTAPVTGVYNFSFGIYRQSATTQYFSLAPRVNGSELSNGDTFIFFQDRTNTETDCTVSGSFLLNLTANDYVELFMRNGASTITVYSGHTFFGGYLVG
jgi:hypothetical protein